MTVRKQLALVEPSVEHEHARELHEIRRLVGEQPKIADLVHSDLIRGLNDSQTGRAGMMSAEQVLMVLFIKQMNDFSYTLLAYHLVDSRTYRAVCGFGIGEKVPAASTLQRDIKKISPQTLEAINRILLASAAVKGIEHGRTVRVDCTVVESNIHHPTDSSLLWDSVRVLSRLTQRAKEISGIVVTDHRRRAKRRALGILNARKNTDRVRLYRDLLKVARKTLNDAERVRRELTHVATTAPITAMALEAELAHYGALAERVIRQTERRVIAGESLRPEDKIVSIFEPHTDIIIKDQREIFFGHKVTITGGASGLLTDLVIERGNPADVTLAEKMISRQNDIYGRVPRQAAFDGGFASKDNLKSIKGLGVCDVAFAKKRGLAVSEMAKSTWVYKRLRDFRAGIEGMISFLKRCFGLTRCTWRGLESFQSYAWSSVVTANLLLMARRLLV